MNRIYKMKKFLIILGLFAISTVLVGYIGKNSRTIYTSNIEINRVSTIATPTPSYSQEEDRELFEAVQAGRVILKRSPPLKNENTKKEIALAIFDKETHNVTEHRYQLDTTQEKYTGVITITPNKDASPLVNITYWNGYNSTYEVASPSGSIVVANKYPVTSSILGSLPEKKATKFSDIVYVPYSENLKTNLNIKAGEKYLDTIIDKAYQDLDAKKVMSIANPTELITDQIPKELVKTIILIEHIDPSSFLTAPDGGRDLLDRVLVILGTNQETGYRYSISPAGASGISQFIRPTYKSMVERYPDAKLIGEYTLGTTDHINAVKAMLCFFDTHIKQIREYIADNESEKPIHLTEEMLAATYNGGPFRVSQAISKHGMAWIYSQLDDSGSKKMFPRETIDYVRKFSAIRNILKQEQ